MNNLIEIPYNGSEKMLISPSAVVCLRPFGQCSSEITVEINGEQETYQIDHPYEYIKSQMLAIS